MVNCKPTSTSGATGMAGCPIPAASSQAVFSGMHLLSGGFAFSRSCDGEGMKPQNITDGSSYDCGADAIELRCEKTPFF